MKKILSLFIACFCFSCGVNINSTKFSSNIKLGRSSVFIYFTGDLLLYSEGISEEIQKVLKQKNIPASVELIFASKPKTEEEKDVFSERRNSVITESVNQFKPEHLVFIRPNGRSYVNGVLESVKYIITIMNVENQKLWQAKMFIATSSVDKIKKNFSEKLFEKLKEDGLIL